MVGDHRGLEVIRAICVALALIAAPACATETAVVDRLAPLAFLEGCWVGTFEGAALRDERCFERGLNGHILRDRHEVVGAGYGGETIYAWNAEAQRIDVMYYANDGGVMTGRVAEEGGVLSVLDARYVSESGVQNLRSRWVRSGDGFAVETDRFESGAWVRFMRITYVRASAQ